MVQMKEQNKSPEKELNKMEISNLSDAQFETLFIRMLKEIIGCCNSIKKTQTEMKITLSEIKKNLQGTYSGGDEAGTQINDLEQNNHSIITTREKEIKNEDRLWRTTFES